MPADCSVLRTPTILISIYLTIFRDKKEALHFGNAARAIRNTIECTLREHSIVMNRVFALLPASAEHPAQHSRAAADHQCSKKVITDILKTVIDYQSQSCQHTKIQTPGQKSP